MEHGPGGGSRLAIQRKDPLPTVACSYEAVESSQTRGVSFSSFPSFSFPGSFCVALLWNISHHGANEHLIFSINKCCGS